MNYKEYSLSQLEDWMSDLLSNNEVSPQDIFNTIKKSVNDTYEYHKHQSSRSYELLGLLNGYDRGVLLKKLQMKNLNIGMITIETIQIEKIHSLVNLRRI